MKWESEKVKPLGMVLEGDGFYVEIAFFEASNEDGLNNCLVKIEGLPAINEGVHGKPIFHSCEPAGTGVNFVCQKNEKSFVRLTSRTSWGNWQNFELYFGSKSYFLNVNHEKAKLFNPNHLFSEFKNLQKT